MAKQMIEAEVPEGYRIKQQTDKPGMKLTFDLEKIQPRRIVLEETDEDNLKYTNGFYANQVLGNGVHVVDYPKIWKQVKENDLSLNSDEPKLSLSVAECKELMQFGGFVKGKVWEFIKENS